MYFKPVCPKPVTPMGGRNRGSKCPEEWELCANVRAETVVCSVWGDFTRDFGLDMKKRTADDVAPWLMYAVWDFARGCPDVGVRISLKSSKGAEIFVCAFETIGHDDFPRPEGVEYMYVYPNADFRNCEQITHMTKEKFEREIQKIAERAVSLYEEKQANA